MGSQKSPLFEKTLIGKSLFGSSEFHRALKEGVAHFKKTRKPIPYEKLSDIDRFWADTFRSLWELEKKYKDLSACLYFISSYPKNLRIGKFFSRKEYIIYHLEFYYIGIIALYDRLLKFINHLYDLGLDERDTRDEIIMRHSKVDPKIKKLLRAYRNGTDRARRIQNQIKHKEGMTIKELDNPSALEFLAAQEDSFLKKHSLDSEFLKKGAKFLYGDFLFKRKKELKKNEEEMFTFLHTLLDEMHPQFIKRLGNIKR